MRKKFCSFLKWFFFSGIWIALIVLALDIVSKNVVFAQVKQHEVIDLIPGFLGVTLEINPKAAFGIGTDNYTLNRIVYIIFALLAIGVIIVFYSLKYKKMSMLLRTCLLLIATGALGNLIDRMFYYQTDPKYGVIDWIDFYGIWHFPFNLADSAIVVATIILIIYLIIEEVKDYKTQKLASPNVEEKVLSVDEKNRLADSQDVNKSEEKAHKNSNK